MDVSQKLPPTRSTKSVLDHLDNVVSLVRSRIFLSELTTKSQLSISYHRHSPNTMEDHHGRPDLQVLISLDEFADDLDLRLGRANGNIYHRREGIEGVHDGQVMVRLKKKRFIIVDYSIIPTEADIQAAAMNPHISVPKGAGKQKCATPECPKVGVPVLLYDSDPTEPSSLYMRSGLCFTCQRNLNEKRRTQRKRVGDVQGNTVLYAVGPGQKKVKLNGNTMELNSDAIILNGPPLDGTKSVREGFSFDDIGPDLTAAVHQASLDAERLVGAISSNATTTVGTPSSSDYLAATVEEAAHAAVDASNSLLGGDIGRHSVTDPQSHSIAATSPQPPPSLPSNEDINVLYEKTFASLSRSVFLLTQWKQSWDAAIAAAVARETVGDPSLADAVASAAAVVALGADGPEANSANMASLLMAADQRKDNQHHHHHLHHTGPDGLPSHHVDLDPHHHPHHQHHHYHHPDDDVVDDVVVSDVEDKGGDNVQSFPV